MVGMINRRIGFEENLIITMLEAYIKKAKWTYANICVNRINWDRLFRLLLEQKLFVCCFNTLKDVIPKQFLHKWMAEYYMIKSHINKDMERASNIQKLIAEKGYLSAISKGFVYSRLVYDDNYMRQYNDIDIYVDVDNIFEIGKSLIEEGYTIKALNNECIAKKC